MRLGNNKGISFLELIISVAIICTLMAISVSEYSRYRIKVNQIMAALDIKLYIHSFQIAQVTDTPHILIRGKYRRVKHGAVYHSPTFMSADYKTLCSFRTKAIYRKEGVVFKLKVIPSNYKECYSLLTRGKGIKALADMLVAQKLFLSKL